MSAWRRANGSAEDMGQLISRERKNVRGSLESAKTVPCGPVNGSTVGASLPVRHATHSEQRAK